MKMILDDPVKFFDVDGGWSQINPECETDESSDESDEDETFQPTDVESSGEESASNSEHSEASDDSVSGEDEPDSSEESGKDWSDLEREAEADDCHQETNFEEENSRSKNKRHHGSLSNEKKDCGQSLKRARKT